MWCYPLTHFYVITATRRWEWDAIICIRPGDLQVLPGMIVSWVNHDGLWIKRWICKSRFQQTSTRYVDLCWPHFPSTPFTTCSSARNRQRHICLRLVIADDVINSLFRIAHHYVHLKQIRISLIHILCSGKKTRSDATAICILIDSEPSVCHYFLSASKIIWERSY